MLRSIGSSVEARGATIISHVGRLAEVRDSDAWRRADVLLAADTLCEREDIVAAPGLRAIVTPALGVDGFDEKAASAAGVLVVNGQVAENYESMAEATILLALACLYDLPGQQRRLLSSDGFGSTEPTGRMLKKRTVGIIGFGNVAQAVVRRLQGWDVNVLIYSRRAQEPNSHGEFVSLNNLLSNSDVVMVLCSLNPESWHMLNAKSLSLLQRGAVLVNTARGGVIDEAALIELSRNGHFSYVGLDVFEEEPLPFDSALRQLGRTILTPHAIGHTTEALAAIRERAVDNLVEILQGHANMPVRNPEVLDRWRLRWNGKDLI